MIAQEKAEKAKLIVDQEALDRALLRSYTDRYFLVIFIAVSLIPRNRLVAVINQQLSRDRKTRKVLDDIMDGSPKKYKDVPCDADITSFDRASVARQESCSSASSTVYFAVRF